MPCTLPYGINAHVELDLPAGKLLAVCGEPLGEPLVDVARAVETVLAEPLNYPALARATVPGDRIVLALEHGVPQAAMLVAAVANYLVEHGTAANQLVVLRTPEAVKAGEDDPRALLPAAWRGEVEVEVHAPETDGSLSLLGSSHEGKSVYLNRTLLDADLVVPIGCLRASTAIGYHGQYGGLFPSFADVKTRDRFHQPLGQKGGRQRASKWREEIDEVGWLLGTQFTMQALPGGADRLLSVLAGEIPEVFRVGQAAYSRAWTVHVPRHASLVIASVTGDAPQQTWENVARALSAASQVVAEGGAIALCTELAQEPGDAVRRLSQGDDLSVSMRRIARDTTPDAAVAAELAHAMEQGKVYLLSRLDETLVEDLGLAAVGQPSELGRLARKHASCIALANAQFAIPVPQDT